MIEIVCMDELAECFVKWQKGHYEPVRVTICILCI